MRTTLRPVTVTLAAAALVAAPATAFAAPSGAPGVARPATPAHACAAIPAALAQFGIEPEGFRYASCVKELSGRPSELELPAGKPYEQCAALEAGVEFPGGTLQISYPYTFHAEPGDPFPDLTAANRGQCARALYAYHVIEEYFPAPEEG